MAEIGQYQPISTEFKEFIVDETCVSSEKCSNVKEVSRMILVSGGRSFLISRGSRGVSVAN